ncbi:LuxR family transcriptional regulator [Microbispora corallina]|nr:LuxR family transcriptional regulator [Microbispora corallina]
MSGVRWPMSGRAREIGEIVETVHAGVSLVVTGEPGVGKTALIRRAVRELGGVTVAAVPGTSLPPEPTGPLLLVVERAYLLDPASARRVHDLVASGEATLLAEARTGAEPPGPVAALLVEGLATRWDLSPLPAEHAVRILAAALRGPVDGATAQRLWRAAAGNMRLLRELVETGLASGRLSLMDDRWTLSGDLPLGDRVRELVRDEIGHLDDGEREALDLLAVAGEVDVDALERLTSPAALHRLERRGLVRAHRLGTRLQVRFARPIHRAALREDLGPIVVRDLLRRLGRPAGHPVNGGSRASGDFSRREQEVAQLASWGMTNREIAEWLGLSPRTVGNHLCRVYTKLGVADRSRLGSIGSAG